MTINTLTATKAYTYTTDTPPTITAIDITSASPALKTTVTLTGTNFDTDKSLISARIVNSDSTKPSYPVSIFSSTATKIVLVMSGGKQGTYSLFVDKSGIGGYTYDVSGTTTAIQFEYKFVMTGVSPLSGSTEGGTILTITGVNFATKTN
jgi:hypothetical protein